MSAKGVEITKATPSVGVALPDLKTSGLIANAVAVADKFVLNRVYEIRSLKDAEEQLGITADYDTTHKVVLHHHISEFYHGVGLQSKVKLYVMGVAQDKTLAQMVDAEGTIGKKIIHDSGGEVFQIMVARNPVYTGEDAYSPTILNGLDSEVWAAIPKAQGLVNWAFGKMYPTRIILEGKSFTPPATSLGSLRAMANVKAPNVHVVVSQDYDYAHKDTAFHTYAAVGTFGGTLARAQLHENVAWVDEFNLTDAIHSRWLRAAFSNHQAVKTLEEDWPIIDEKGYIFAQKYAHVAGFRWNNDHSCTPIEVDTEGNMNEAYARFGRTMDGVVLSAYAALIGRVKSPQPVDPQTGKLPRVVISELKAAAEKRIDQDRVANLSGREVVIDKDSNLLPPSETLNMAVKAVPYGSLSTIKVKVGLVKKV